MMTRKDYVALANALGDVAGKVKDVEEVSVRGWEAAVAECCAVIADVLKSDNNSFRRDQFMEAIEYRATTGKLVKVGQTRFDS